MTDEAQYQAELKQAEAADKAALHRRNDGFALAGLRERWGFSQPALALVLGVDPQTLSRWERGERPLARRVRPWLRVLEETDAEALTPPKTADTVPEWWAVVMRQGTIQRPWHDWSSGPRLGPGHHLSSQ